LTGRGGGHARSNTGCLPKQFPESNLVNYDRPGTMCIYSVLLHYKLEVCGFNDLALTKIQIGVTKFGLMGLLRTHGRYNCIIHNKFNLKYPINGFSIAAQEGQRNRVPERPAGPADHGVPGAAEDKARPRHGDRRLQGAAVG
jgi:hypothetical protein